MPSMDPKDLRDMVNSLGDLNTNLRELVGNMGRVGTTSKSMSTYFQATQKATEDINEKLEKENKTLERIGIAEKLRKTSIKKRSGMLGTLQKSEKKAVSLLLTKNLRSEKIQAQTRINNFKKEKREAAIASRFMMKQEEAVSRKEGTSEKKALAVSKKEAARLGTFKRKQFYKNEMDVGRKREAIHKGTHTGKIAGDVSDAIGTATRPFREKSLNPLNWIKTGSEVKEGLMDAQKGMKDWSTALKQAASSRKASAGKAAKKAATVVGGIDEDPTVGKKSSKKVAENIGNILEDATSNTGKTKAKGIIGGVADAVGAGKKGAGAAGVTIKAASFTKAAQGLGTLVKIVDALGAALGVLSKMNWIFAIISAMSAVVSAGIELDKFLKQLNKTFMTMAGATLGGGDMIKNMKEFNSAVFNISRNLKLGVKAEDVQGMFKAFSEGGQAPQVLSEKAGGYGKVIEMVKKSSIDLGLSFEDTGKLINDQMMDLRDSFDNSRKSLQVMGFQATKAGVTVNKFYGAINNTVSAMSFLGNFTKQASGALVAFMSDSTLSFKDAAKAASDYMAVFNNMDWKQLQVVFAVAGKDLVTAMTEASERIINQPLEKESRKLDILADQIKATSDPAEQKKLIAEQEESRRVMKGLTLRQEDFRDALADYAKNGMTGKLAQYGDLLSASVAQVMTSVREKTGGTGFTPQLAALQKIIPTMSADLVKKIDLGMRGIGDDFNNLSDSFDKGIGQQIQGNDAIIDNIKAMVKYGADNKDNDAILKDLRDKFRQQGEALLKKQGDPTYAKDSAEYADNMVDLIAKGNVSSDKIEGYLENLKKLTVQDAKKYLKPNTHELASIFDSSQITGKNTEDGFDELSKSNKEIIGNTTPIDDLINITKQGVKFALANKMGDSMAFMTKLVGSISGNVSLLAQDKRTDRQKAIGKFTEKSFSGTAFSSTIKNAVANKTMAEDEIARLQDRKDLPEVSKKGAIAKQEENVKKAQSVIDAFYTEGANKGYGKEELEPIVTGLQDQAKQNDILKGKTSAEDSKADKSDAVAKELIDGISQSVINSVDLKIPTTGPSLPGLGFNSDDLISSLISTNPLLAKGFGLKHDFKSLRGGLALLDKGDMAFSPATGVAGSKGTLAEDALTKMGLFDAPMAKGDAGTQPAQYAINLGGININGNVEDPLVVRRIGEKLVDMVEQTIIKHDREKMLRKG